MPGLNTTGAPNTRDYFLGRGIVRAANLNAAGLPDTDGFRDLGNAQEFNANVTTETAPHQASRTAVKFTDSRCTVSQEIGLSFILDELNFQNLADFFSGSTAIYDNPHDAIWVAHENSVHSASVKVGNWYELYDEGAGPGTQGTGRVYNLDAAGVTYEFETDPSGIGVALVEGTDYELDKEMGLVRYLPTGSVIDGDEVGWALTAAASTPQDLDEVQALTQASISVALLFVGVNACDGNKTEVLFHRARLTADGDLALISDEYSQLPFSGVAEANSAITSGSQVLRVRTYDQLA